MRIWHRIRIWVQMSTKKEVVIVLLTDEQYVVKWLSQYGALPRAQIIKMLQKPPQTAERILQESEKANAHCGCFRRLLYRT